MYMNPAQTIELFIAFTVLFDKKISFKFIWLEFEDETQNSSENTVFRGLCPQKVGC